MRNVIKDIAKHLPKRDKSKVGYVGFRHTLAEAFQALRAEHPSGKLSNGILEINVLTTDGFGITIDCSKAQLRIGEFDLIRDRELGERLSEEVLLQLLSRFMNARDENGRRFFSLRATIMMSDDFFVRAGVTKRKAREAWIARAFNTSEGNVHQELNKLYKSRKRGGGLPANQLPLIVQEVIEGIRAAIAKGEIDEEGVTTKR